MKIKKNLIFLTIILASICLFIFSNKVNAATISNDGKYSLVLNVMDGEIDGEYAKLIRFNVAEGETTVKLSELTKGIVPFNGRNEFSYWGKNIFNEEKASDELAITDFNHTGESNGVSYTNGLVLWAKFSDKALQGTGTYYLTLDPFAGTINGKENLRLTSKSTEFETVDLTKYIPVRKGYTFKGWDLDGKFVTSINSSNFANCDAVNVTAIYTKDTFLGDDIVLVLNANGGTIDGKESNKYDYINGANSGTYMSLLPYVPVKEGYKFTGWNTKKDGSGKSYNYMYWRSWNKDVTSTAERDTLIKDGNMYKNLTLYATWTKNANTPATPDEPSRPTQPTQNTVKEIKSTGEVKTNIEFADGINKNYKLDIKKLEVKEKLAQKNIKFIADINVLDGNNVVKINNTKMKIRIAMPEDLKGYNKYEVVYILNGEIKETIPATVENGYIVFETSHLSEYGVVATNVNEQVNNNEEKNKTNSSTTVENETNNPKTADNITFNLILFGIALFGTITLPVINKKQLGK